MTEWSSISDKEINFFFFKKKCPINNKWYLYTFPFRKQSFIWCLVELDAIASYYVVLGSVSFLIKWNQQKHCISFPSYFPLATHHVTKQEVHTLIHDHRELTSTIISTQVLRKRLLMEQYMYIRGFLNVVWKIPHSRKPYIKNSYMLHTERLHKGIGHKLLVKLARWISYQTHTSPRQWSTEKGIPFYLRTHTESIERERCTLKHDMFK